MKIKKTLTVITIMVMIFAISASDAIAQQPGGKYRDKSDELPGMMSTGEVLLIAGGAVVVAGGIITFLVIKKKQDRKLAAVVPESPFFNITGIRAGDCREQSSGIMTFCNDVTRASENAPVLVFTRLDRIHAIDQGNNRALSLGVRINF